MKDFTELDVWKKARMLASTIYDLTESFPDKERYRLTDQMCRSSVSIPSNIAEGLGRNSSKDKMRFMHMARGSAFELETQLYIAKDLEYLEEEIFSNVLESIVSVKKLINGFLSYLQKTIP